MVCVELAHNPYLSETSFLLNGQSPRVNSAIEKYEHLPLVDWVDKVPVILRDEMNGYDFELDFSGTESDFEELQKSFAKARVSEEMVHLFHRGTLEGVKEKRSRSFSLLEWLRENANRQFDYDAFFSSNPIIFEKNLPFVVLHGDPISDTTLPLSTELIENIHELDGTDLTNTPILIRVSADTAQLVRTDVATLLGRADVKQIQLFFAIGPTLNKAQSTRTLMDLGIENPQVISRLDDPSFLRFVENYPLAEQVRLAVQAFRTTVQSISDTLDAEEERSAQFNAEDKRRIQEIEDDIERLKAAEDYFSHLPNMDEPDGYQMARVALLDALAQWKSRKTKISGDDNIHQAASEYEAVARTAYFAYITSVSCETDNVVKRIRAEFRREYEKAEVDKDFEAGEPSVEPCASEPAPDFESTFLDLVEVTYEEQKNDFFSLFSSATPDENGRIRVATCYLEKWRSEAARMLEPMTQKLLSDHEASIGVYRDALAGAYRDHVVELIEEKRAEREKLSEKLSDDEKLLQADEDWLTTFRDQLQDIERA